MSDTQANSRQRTIDYMVRLLEMNPVHQCEEIIQVRNGVLGATKAKPLSASAEPTKSPDQLQSDRRQLLQELEGLRAEFWTLPLEELHRRLGKLDGQGFADIESAVARLRAVAEHWPSFPALSNEEGFDGEFFSTLKEILIRSSRETAVLREQVLSMLQYSSKKRKSTKRMLQLIKKQMPQLYDLEANWFETAYRHNGRTTSPSQEPNRRVVLFAVVAGIGISIAITMVLGDARPNKTKTRQFSVPTVRYTQPIPQGPTDRFRNERPRPQLRNFGPPYPLPNESKDDSDKENPNREWDPFGNRRPSWAPPAQPRLNQNNEGNKPKPWLKITWFGDNSPPKVETNFGFFNSRAEDDRSPR